MAVGKGVSVGPGVPVGVAGTDGVVVREETEGLFVGVIVGVKKSVGVGVIVTNASVCGDKVGKFTFVGVMVGVGEPLGKKLKDD